MEVDDFTVFPYKMECIAIEDNKEYVHRLQINEIYHGFGYNTGTWNMCGHCKKQKKLCSNKHGTIIEEKDHPYINLAIMNPGTSYEVGEEECTAPMTTVPAPTAPHKRKRLNDDNDDECTRVFSQVKEIFDYGELRIENVDKELLVSERRELRQENKRLKLSVEGIVKMLRQEQKSAFNAQELIKKLQCTVSELEDKLENAKTHTHVDDLREEFYRKFYSVIQSEVYADLRKSFLEDDKVCDTDTVRHEEMLDGVTSSLHQLAVFDPNISDDDYLQKAMNMICGGPELMH